MTPTAKRRPILVPIDFSENSETALLQAAELCEALKAKLVVLHVVHDLSQAPGFYAEKVKKKQLRRMEDIAAEMLQEFMADIRKKHDKLTALQQADSLLVMGIPVTRILETAGKLNACMIVMGSQGRTGLSHILLGSKAEQVVRLAKIPVLIVKKPGKK